MNYVGLNIHGNTFDTTTFQYGFWHAIRWMINNARYIFLSAKSLTRSKANPQQRRCQLRVEQHRESMLSGVDVFSLSHSPIDLTTLGRLLFQSPATTLFPRALIRTWLTFCVPPRPVSQRTPLLNTAASLKQMSKKRAETAQLLPALPARASERWIWKNGVWPRSYLCSDLRAHKFVTREEYMLRRVHPCLKTADGAIYLYEANFCSRGRKGERAWASKINGDSQLLTDFVLASRYFSLERLLLIGKWGCAKVSTKINLDPSREKCLELEIPTQRSYNIELCSSKSEISNFLGFSSFSSSVL